MINVDNCLVCNSNNVVKIKDYEYHYPEKIEDYYRDKRLRVAFDKLAKCDREGTLKYKICKCNDCSFIFLNPRYTNEEVSIKYYWIVEGMGIEEPDINKMNIEDMDKQKRIKERFAWVDKIKRKRIKEFLGKYANPEAKSLLDFGGADGKMCRDLVDKYDCEVIEMTKHIMCKGVKYIGRNFEYCKGREYDIILLIHVLEHLNKPLEYLLALKKYLKKETGIILIAVPLGSLVEWKVLAEPLTHCNFFNEGSLSTLTARAGFNFLEETSYPFSRFTEPQEFGEIYYIGKIIERK